MAHDVFISHSSGDKPIADAICASLEAQEIRCWIAPRDILVGRAFSGQITLAIQNAKVILLLFSAHSNDSPEVLREVQLAARERKHIVNLRIENVPVSADLDYFLSLPHWLDAITPPMERHFKQVGNTIRSLLEIEPRPSPTPPPSQPLSHSSNLGTRIAGVRAQFKGRERHVGIAVALVLLTGLAVSFGYRSFRSAKANSPHGEESKPFSVSEPVNATKTQPFVNTLGMKFVPVPGTKVLFSIWDTRVQDYERFVQATAHDWDKPDFSQEPTEPAVNQSWEDAVAFCAWLSAKEGRIYRLPTDVEWSAAVGPQRFPWGEDYPPPKGAGNYAHSLFIDDFDGLSPVGSFPANRFGLYDMGGNVWQWCADKFRPSMNSLDLFTNPADDKLRQFLETADQLEDGPRRVLRGGSNFDRGEMLLRSSFHFACAHLGGQSNFGFRCVLVLPDK